ncbi:gamma-tubulin complex DGRIP91/SPC98 component [Panus rudis PR-1116 ss-1]|nr:gamma-tubulin complex DGRIP91/SPC98 component [Panus rudis PR-1116 ss-1]
MSSSLETLVCTIVPQARQDSSLKEELITHCKEILTSNIGQTVDVDINHLADSIKRHLLHVSSNSGPALRFTNLLPRLLEQPILSRKNASLQFLYSLAASPQAPSVTPQVLPTLALPSVSRPASTIPSPADPSPVQPIPKGKTQAELLKEYRRRYEKPHLSEYLLLRDALYLLQGISGKYVYFSAGKDPEATNQVIFRDDSKYMIPAATKTLILCISEVGHLYMRIDAFIREREGKPSIGMIEQSLCHHLQNQLTDYYRLIAILESQLSTSKSKGDGIERQDEDLRHIDTGLTLKRLNVFIQDWRLRMRMMSVCVEGARDAHGGALVNLIHSYADNGDPFVRKFTDQLLEEVSKPFFATLHKWLFSGELSDPFSEFFVAVDPELAHVQYVQQSPIGQLGGDGGFGGLVGDSDDITGEREGGLKLWESKFKFHEDMLPSFLGKTFGRKIFSTGKSLNFIRYSCHDSDWVVTREKLSNTGGTLKYSDITGLERSIDAAYQIASRRLFDIFFEKYRLLDHLLALKNYLLLGHGDFIDQLMETLSPSLSKPANTLYRHNLTATLESAIRLSSAQNDSPDVLRRLDARMLEYSHGEIGWDVFTLEYKVDAPIDTVLDPEAMVKYLKLFNHLWKIKRIEATLSKVWMRVAGGARTFLQLPELSYEWHQIRIVMAEMIHFIRQMEAYCQLEVIECSWKTLLDFVQKKEGDLDALIEAHRAYLDRMLKKVLLLSSKTGREENLLNQAREVFTTILQFREATDDFYNYSLSESARRDAERDEQRGVFTGHQRTSRHSPEALASILSRIREYSGTFTEKVQSIVQGLQSHSDLDCRFLGIRLSFSDFYRLKREQMHPKA